MHPMTPESLFIVIIAIVVFNFLFSRIMEYLNASRYGDPIPEGLEDVYEAEEYRTSKDSTQVNYRFAILTGAFSFMVILLMFFFEGFAFADKLARSVTENPILTALLFFGGLMFLLHCPFFQISDAVNAGRQFGQAFRDM